MLSSDNMLELSLSLGGVGWHACEVNTLKKYLLKGEALAKSELAGVKSL